jgi:hypothetical protein
MARDSLFKEKIIFQSSFTKTNQPCLWDSCKATTSCFLKPVLLVAAAIWSAASIVLNLTSACSRTEASVHRLYVEDVCEPVQGGP